MKHFLEAYLSWVRRVLPSPLSIALILTILTACIVLLVGEHDRDTLGLIKQTWSEGLWSSGLMVFAMQMMLMLVLGHILALSPPVRTLINKAVQPCNTTAKAAMIVSFFTMIVALFNWGLGLIFGAIMARKVGEKAHAESLAINYPLVGAAGYVGLMVWHGGLSGSSLIKVAEGGHLASLMGEGYARILPAQISLAETVFAPMNLTVSLALLIAVPTVLYFIGQRLSPTRIKLQPHTFEALDDGNYVGAELLDHRRALPLAFGVMILLVCFGLAQESGWLSFFTPNNINLLLFGLCMVFHPSIASFNYALEDAIKGASGILIQFPLYFGILAMMRESGLIVWISDFFIRISTSLSYPIYTFFSAGIVNIFVPSGGGQWAIQGPIIISSSQELGVPLHKAILAMAYGDQLTNMLQPFWALPLLGITRLTARDILPYTLLLFLTGTVIFIAALLLF